VTAWLTKVISIISSIMEDGGMEIDDKGRRLTFRLEQKEQSGNTNWSKRFKWEAPKKDVIR